MSDKTGPLTLREFETLANLLRRFEVNHTTIPARQQVAQQAYHVVRTTYAEKYMPGYAEPAAPKAKPDVPMTAGPNPIPVHELPNAESVWEILPTGSMFQ